jgi:HEAT repeat protein
MARTSVHLAVGTLLLAVAVSVQAQDLRELDTLDVDALVQQLRHVPSAMPAGAPSNGVEHPTEVQRRRIYGQLLVLSPDSIHALARGFQDPDTEFRRNVALALGVLSGGWWSFSGNKRKVDLTPVLPELIAALNDTDSKVRGWAAQDIGNVGAGAVTAVPALLTLLVSEDEGLRNSACIALREIGPSAAPALPALKRALSDPSADVRRFADLAIRSIEGQRPGGRTP